MFNFIFTTLLEYIILFSAVMGLVATLCLPCQVAYSNLWYPGLPRRAVYNPKITSPTFGTEWKAGSAAIVTWDASGIPPSTPCRVILGYLNDGSTDEHLQLNNPLAGEEHCDLSRGQVSVTIPTNTKPGNNYIVVVMGDSGNRSEKFAIN